MRLIKSLVRFGRDAADYVSVLFDNSVEKKAIQRASELALDVARLEDQVEDLKFNGPTLFRSEVDAIKTAIALMNSLPDVGEAVNVLQALLDRSDQMAEIESIKEFDDVTMDVSKLHVWGCDKCVVGVSADENSNATLEINQCEECKFAKVYSEE